MYNRDDPANDFIDRVISRGTDPNHPEPICQEAIDWLESQRNKTLEQLFSSYKNDKNLNSDWASWNLAYTGDIMEPWMRKYLFSRLSDNKEEYRPLVRYLRKHYSDDELKSFYEG